MAVVAQVYTALNRKTEKNSSKNERKLNNGPMFTPKVYILDLRVPRASRNLQNSVR